MDTPKQPPDETGQRIGPQDKPERTPGDGTLTGAVPAGLTAEELDERARAPEQPNNTGTG